MAADNFEAWKLCWEVNLAFYRPLSGALACFVCSQTHEYAAGTSRSSFWLQGTRCSAGHRQATRAETSAGPQVGVCASCDQDFLLNVVNGEQPCRRRGCRRKMRVNEAEIRQRIAHNDHLLRLFLRLVRGRTVYECTICCDKKDAGADLVIQQPPTLECNHDREACDDCLKNMFEVAIQGGRLQDLICPDTECKRPIPKGRIKQLVSETCYKQYNKKLTLATMSKDPKFRWCSCGNGQIHEPGERFAEWKCVSCNKTHCFICNNPTTSTACEHMKQIDLQRKRDKDRQREAARRVLQEKEQQKKSTENATRREVARTTKKCPKAGCNNKIERNDGCGHFTCNVCKTEFCWVCKVIWKNKVPLHLTGCKIGTTRTIERRNLNTVGYASGWDKDPGYDISLDEGVWLIGGHR